MQVEAAIAERPAVVPMPAPVRYRAREPMLRRAEHTNTTWSLRVLAGTPFEEVLRPEFWAHVAQKGIVPNDKIDLHPEEGHYNAELRVRDVGPNWLKVHVIYKDDYVEQLTRSDDDEFPGYSIEWKGPVRRFSVIRQSDKTAIGSEFANKQTARLWLVEHMKAMVR